MNKEIAIIIPAYNAHDTIERLLFSIAAQTIVDHAQIIIIDDCSDKSYYELVEKFFFLDIIILKTKQNSGPGEARNIGITYTIKKEIPYIIFCDADDILLFNLFLENALEEMPEADFVFSNFYESVPKGMIAHQDNDVWLFGKMYKTSIIKQHNIKFIGNSNSNEDVAFNLWYWLCCDKKVHLNFYTYLWQYNDKSITRKKENNYLFKSYPKMCENLCLVYQMIEKDTTISKEKIKDSISDRIIRIYIGFNELYDCAEEEYSQEEQLQAIRKLYQSCFKKYFSEIPQEDFYTAWENNNYSRLPKIGFIDFIKKIREG